MTARIRTLTLALLATAVFSLGCDRGKAAIERHAPTKQETPRATSSPAPSSRKAYKPDDIEVLWMTLKVGGKDSLLVILTRDGMVNRQGTGIAGEREELLYIGQHPGVFEQVLKSVDAQVLSYTGAYDVAEKRGEVCELEIHFEFKDKQTDGYTIRYGLESEGPPREVARIVIDAIEKTEPMYQEALSKQAGEKAPKNGSASSNRR